jgi:hypothetical protein
MGAHVAVASKRAAPSLARRSMRGACPALAPSTPQPPSLQVLQGVLQALPQRHGARAHSGSHGQVTAAARTTRKGSPGAQPECRFASTQGQVLGSAQAGDRLPGTDLPPRWAASRWSCPCCPRTARGPTPGRAGTAKKRGPPTTRRLPPILRRALPAEFHAFHYGTEPGKATEKLQEDLQRTVDEFAYSNLRIMKASAGGRAGEPGGGEGLLLHPSGPLPAVELPAPAAPRPACPPPPPPYTAG